MSMKKQMTRSHHTNSQRRDFRAIFSLQAAAFPFPRAFESDWSSVVSFESEFAKCGSAVSYKKKEMNKNHSFAFRAPSHAPVSVAKGKIAV